jgi:hypothetical protein
LDYLAFCKANKRQEFGAEESEASFIVISGVPKAIDLNNSPCGKYQNEQECRQNYT